MAETIKLGQRVQDVVTGFIGVAFCKVELLTGTLQYQILPRVPQAETEAGTGKFPESICLDDISLRAIADTLTHIVVPVPESTPHFELGSTVRDRVTQFVGIAVRRYTFMNGCVYYDIEGPNRSDSRTKPELNVFVPAQRLELARTEKLIDPTVLRSNVAHTGGPPTAGRQMR